MNFHTVEFEASFGLHSQLPASDLVEIAFAGRSNVGKSSMINKLFNRKTLARVSQVPGKTSTINFYRTGNVRIVDLPGYGFAKVSKGEKKRWAGLMEGYFTSGRNLQLVFQLVDMRHPPTADDRGMLDFLVEGEFPFVVILTKADKLPITERARRLEALAVEIPYSDQVTIVPFSARTGEGVERVREIIRELAGDDGETSPEEE